MEHSTKQETYVLSRSAIGAAVIGLKGNLATEYIIDFCTTRLDGLDVCLAITTVVLINQSM